METSFECVIVIIIVIVSVSVRDGNLHVRDGRCEHYTPVTVHVHANFLRTFGPKRFDGCFANKEYKVGMQSMRLFGLRTDHAEDVHHADANRLEKKKTPTWTACSADHPLIDGISSAGRNAERRPH